MFILIFVWNGCSLGTILIYNGNYLNAVHGSSSFSSSWFI